MKAIELHVTGIVQGVGFRPFVYGLAVDSGLNGWVLNASDGVHCVVEGEDSEVDAFPFRLREQAPAMAVIEHVIVEDVEPEGFTGFEIRESHAQPGEMTLVSPDIATCPDCLSELFDPSDRRFGYPFINCTNCGPRFTIIDDIPYDRPMTTMRDFPMCPDCAAEYGDPADRRFHAQPDACFVCGPRLYLMRSPDATHGDTPAADVADGTSAATEPLEAAESPTAASSETDTELPAEWAWSPECETTPRPHRDRDAESQRTAELLDRAAELIDAGAILAIKGLGGFHLACDATNADAVNTLRARKHRWGKPLAIMVRDIEDAERYCLVGDEERKLLEGVVRPIVLLRRRPEADALVPASVAGLAPAGIAGSVPAAGAGSAPAAVAGFAPAAAGGLASGVADGLAEIGVMLPYTPLHHLLLARTGRPLVMTSGNLSDEPIATANTEAIDRLGAIADYFLMHDRGIHSRYDDSVLRVVNGIVEPVRRARGYAPHPTKLPFESDIDILAAGPEQKNTFCLVRGGYAFVSQHIGDLENAETLASYESTVELYERLFRVEPALVAHDLHPEYLSTKWALGLDLPKVGVQHHHAHVVSVTAEHGVDERVAGVAFDGTGFGEDGRIWGGEVLLCDWAGYERFAHLRYVPMPGGSGAIRRPARMALGTLAELGLLDHPGAAPLRSRLAEGEEATLLTMISRGVNSPLTSSMGRLFDSVAAIVGIADDARYEGEAAILLEAAADMSAEGSYTFGFNDDDPSKAPIVIDIAPVLSAILEDVAGGIPTGVISARFHRAVVGCIVSAGSAATRRAGTQKVALAGGVFMNRLVLGGAVAALRDGGLSPLTHVSLPMNDAAVSLGQAVVAWARRRES